MEANIVSGTVGANHIHPGLLSTYPLTSLYVGDLHQEVTEAMLFEKFSQTGPVLSIRVCRDIGSSRSLGYAYVNFQRTEDAERALDTMNFDVIRGRPIRLMWSQRDPSLRKSGVGNIFIKNLDKSIDNKDMYDTFSTFGVILSCKVALDDDGMSKGYGFVHFETEESAKKAIEKVNGMLLSDKKLFVGHFIPRKERERMQGGKPKFCNLYVKNIPPHFDEIKFRELFEEFGTITSVCIVLDETGLSRGFGFVCFQFPEQAARACEEVNSRELEGKQLYVGRAQRKSERQLELRRKFEQIKMEKNAQSAGVNLYVKNIEETWRDDDLRATFQHFGLITSAKIMTTEDGKSKGFGFVCFTQPEEAAHALNEMTGKPVVDGGKPLYVALAQRREDRKVFLTQQYMQRMVNLNYENNNNNMRAAQLGQLYSPGNYFMPTMTQGPRFFQAAQMAGPGMMPTPRWAQPPQVQMRPMTQQVAPGFPVVMQAHYRPPNRSGSGAGPIGPPVACRSYSNIQRQIPGPRPNGPYQPQMSQHIPYQQSRGPGNGVGPRISQNITTNMALPRSNHPSPIPGQMGYAFKASQTFQPNAIPFQGRELTASSLAAAHPNDQKQMLGERLFPLIQERFPILAGKITGMLLEMDNTEILNLIDHRELLDARILEAKNTLDLHNKPSSN